MFSNLGDPLKCCMTCRCRCATGKDLKKQKSLKPSLQPLRSSLPKMSGLLVHIGQTSSFASIKAMCVISDTRCCGSNFSYHVPGDESSSVRAILYQSINLEGRDGVDRLALPQMSRTMVLRSLSKNTSKAMKVTAFPPLATSTQSLSTADRGNAERCLRTPSQSACKQTRGLFLKEPSGPRPW